MSFDLMRQAFVTHHPACPLASLSGRMNRDKCACPDGWPVRNQFELQPPLRRADDRVTDGRHLFPQESTDYAPRLVATAALRFSRDELEAAKHAEPGALWRQLRG